MVGKQKGSSGSPVNSPPSPPSERVGSSSSPAKSITARSRLVPLTDTTPAVDTIIGGNTVVSDTSLRKENRDISNSNSSSSSSVVGGADTTADSNINRKTSASTSRLAHHTGSSRSAADSCSTGIVTSTGGLANREETRSSLEEATGSTAEEGTGSAKKATGSMREGTSSMKKRAGSPMEDAELITPTAGAATLRAACHWSVEEVAHWVAGLGLDDPDAPARFRAQRVNGEVLLALTEKDLKEELGLMLLGERRSVTLAIARLCKHPHSSPTLASSANSSAHSSPQHSPVTHHHYYHHPSPPQLQQQQQQQHCCYQSHYAPSNGDANGGDSGIGGGEHEVCGCYPHHQQQAGGSPAPHLLAHTLHRHQRTSGRRLKRSRNHFSSDSDDEAEEEDEVDDGGNDEESLGDVLSSRSSLAGGNLTVGNNSKRGCAATSATGVVGPGRAVGACVVGGSRVGGACRTAPRLQPEYVKTAISCFYMFLVTWITAIVMVFVHDRVPDRARHPPLPDIFLDNVPHIPWAFQLCEVTILTLTAALGLILCFHKHRCIILRRFAALSGTVFLLRCATMFITSLSVPGSHLQCSPRERRSVWRQVEQAWVIWQGGGLSIKGVRTCGDYMFSGHTTALTMLNFFITEYTPRRMYYVHISSWVLNMFGVFFVLAAHEHYSIDVFIAFYITSRMFLYYHSLANNRALHQRDSFRTKIWFPMFSYFESSIDGIVPNEYSNLLAWSNLVWAARLLVLPCWWLAGKTKLAFMALSGVAGWRDHCRAPTLTDSTATAAGAAEETGGGGSAVDAVTTDGGAHPTVVNTTSIPTGVSSQEGRKSTASAGTMRNNDTSTTSASTSVRSRIVETKPTDSNKSSGVRQTKTEKSRGNNNTAATAAQSSVQDNKSSKKKVH